MKKIALLNILPALESLGISRSRCTGPTIPVGLLLVLLSLLLAGCEAGADASGSVRIVATPHLTTRHPTSPATLPPTPLTTSGPATSTPATSTSTLGDLPVVLEPLDSTFDQPLHLTHAGDGSGRLFVVEKIGTIQVVQEGQKRPDPFLDIRSKVNAQASERGLLSVAFHPAYETNGQFFVNYTNQDGHTVVARYHVSSDPNVADPASEEVILTIEQPAANHNGGQVAFGPDGYLYIGMGDGGAAGDPWGNAQNGAVLLGKLLRIDVDSGSDSSVLYGIPPDNPFLQRSDVRPEIWALGLRNPWRFSFDRATGDLYIADVGQNQYEELNFQPARSKGGENYGWNRMEGNACYPEGEPCQQEELEMPVLVYSHQGSNCSITGGFVYRGSAFPAFQGIYFFADYCSGKVWTLCKTLGGWQSALMLDTGMSISSFGEDEAGELYLTTLWEGKVYQVTAAGDTREE